MIEDVAFMSQEGDSRFLLLSCSSIPIDNELR